MTKKTKYAQESLIEERISRARRAFMKSEGTVEDMKKLKKALKKVSELREKLYVGNDS